MIIIKGRGRACQILPRFIDFCHAFGSMTLGDLVERGFFQPPIEIR